MELKALTGDEAAARPEVQTVMQAFDELRGEIPAGCFLHLDTEAGYHESHIGGEPWKGIRFRWKAIIEPKRSDTVTSWAHGEGRTAREAFDAAVADWRSRSRAIHDEELKEFRNWRAARDRQGLRHPHTEGDWDRAVVQGARDED